MSANNFGIRGSNLTKLFHVTCGEAGMIIWVKLLGVRTHIGMAKTSEIRRAISDNFRLRTQISATQD